MFDLGDEKKNLLSLAAKGKKKRARRRGRKEDGGRGGGGVSACARNISFCRSAQKEHWRLVDPFSDSIHSAIHIVHINASAFSGPLLCLTGVLLNFPRTFDKQVMTWRKKRVGWLCVCVRGGHFRGGLIMFANP